MRDNWQYLFTPGSVAVIGASNAPGSWGCSIMRSLLISTERKVYPVNNRLSEVWGLAAYGSVLDIPGSVDLAVIAVPALQVPTVLRECVQKEVKAAAIVSGGFAETDKQGRKLETELTKIAQQGGICFIGPNSMGYADTSSRLFALTWVGEITPGPVAFISQSGNIIHWIISKGKSSGIGFSKLISTGNEADLHLEDYLEYLAQDENTQIIAAYIEGLREGRRFFELAKETTIRKPVIVVKAGRTKGSAKAVKSHTGALAGSEVAYAAAFKQSGVIRVDDDDELCDIVFALINHPLPRGNRVGILTSGGGLGVMATDICEWEGLNIAPLAASTIEKLNTYLPPRWSHGNPVDTTGMSLEEIPILSSSLQVLLEDKNIDAVLLQTVVGLDASLLNLRGPEEVKAFKEAEAKGLSKIKQWIKEYDKPVFVVPTLASPSATFALRKEGFLAYPNPRRAAKVIHRLGEYRKILETAKLAT